MKLILKYLVALLFYYTGLTYLRLRILGKTRPAVILMYHRVLPEDDPDIKYIQPGLYVTPEVFEKQIEFLLKKLRIISLGELAEAIKVDKHLPLNCAVVTFDDGWDDNYVNAFPILKRYGVPATIFLATDFIGTDNILWFYKAGKIVKEAALEPGRLAQILRSALDSAKSKRGGESLETMDVVEALKALDYESMKEVIGKIAFAGGLNETDFHSKDNGMMTWEQVAEMSRGGIEFGSHGCSHRILTSLLRAQIIEEITCSKKVVEDKLGGEIKLFSYPNGNYNTEIETLLREAGFECAVATGKRGKGNQERDIFALSRVGVHQDTSIGPNGKFSEAMFAFHISGWSALLGRHQGGHERDNL